MPMPMPEGGVPEDTPVGFQPIPNGIYNATVQDYDLKTTSGEGKLEAGIEYYQFTFELTDEGVSGKTLKTPVFFTEAAKPKLKEFLVAMGLDDAAIAGMSEFDPDDYIGTSVKVQVNLGKPTADGTRYNNIQRVLPADDGDGGLPS